MADLPQTSVRLDKWLWAARFYKTRAIAKKMIDGGKVYYNNHRAKSAQLIQIDAIIRLRQGVDDKEIIIKKLSGQRQSAPIAQTLYQETPQSCEKRAENAIARRLNNLSNPTFDGKPDKKQRRQLVRFKQGNTP